MTAAPPESDRPMLGTLTPLDAGAVSARDIGHAACMLAAVPLAGVAWWVTDVAAALPITLVGAIALGAAVIDARTRRIPNRLVIAALAAAGGSCVLVSVVDDRPMPPLLTDLAAGLVLSGAPAMFVIWLVAPRAIGGGDWKLLGVLGIAVGFLAPLGATVIVMGAFVSGVVVAAVVRQRNIILGPPLALGYASAVTAVVLAPELFGNWYR